MITQLADCVQEESYQQDLAAAREAASAAMAARDWAYEGEEAAVMGEWGEEGAVFGEADAYLILGTAPPRSMFSDKRVWGAKPGREEADPEPSQPEQEPEAEAQEPAAG